MAKGQWLCFISRAYNFKIVLYYLVPQTAYSDENPRLSPGYLWDVYKTEEKVLLTDYILKGLYSAWKCTHFGWRKMQVWTMMCRAMTDCTLIKEFFGLTVKPHILSTVLVHQRRLQIADGFCRPWVELSHIFLSIFIVLSTCKFSIPYGTLIEYVLKRINSSCNNNNTNYILEFLTKRKSAFETCLLRAVSACGHYCSLQRNSIVQTASLQCFWEV